jgi:hypothetical protein
VNSDAMTWSPEPMLKLMRAHGSAPKENALVLLFLPRFLSFLPRFSWYYSCVPLDGTILVLYSW